MSDNDLRIRGALAKMTSASSESTLSADKETKSSYYVLFSGLNDWDDTAARNIKAGLLKRHVPSDHIIIVPDTFGKILPEAFQTSDILSRSFYQQFASPQFRQKLSSEGFWQDLSQTASHLRSALARYESLGNPTSTYTQQSYQRFRSILDRHGVKPQDDLVAVGHSAGGQMALTMSEMSRKDNNRYHFRTIVTLGTAVFRNQVPREVRVNSFVSSSGDSLLGFFSETAPHLGYAVSTKLPNQDENDAMYDLPGIEHTAFTKNDAILESIVTETPPKIPQAVEWQEAKSLSPLTPLLNIASFVLKRGLHMLAGWLKPFFHPSITGVH